MGKFIDWCITPSVGKVMDKAIDGLFYYAENQLRWQSGMKEELERLRDNHLKIINVVSAASRAQTNDQNSALNKWIWRLRDAIDEADDLLDDLEYMKHQQQDYWLKVIQVGKRTLKTDPILKRLEEVVQKLDKISAEVSTFLHLLDIIKLEQREQQVELHTTRETGFSPTNVLIGRGEYKESIIDWLRKQSDEEPQTHATTAALYRNISLLSIVGHGGMGKTTLLQHVYEDEITENFDLKIWICVSDNFDVNKVIADLLEYVNDHRPSLQSLSALQKSLKSKVKSKKFLLILDDIWDDKEEKEAKLMDKWRKVLAPLSCGGLGSKILITTRTDSAASMIAKVIGKKKEVKKLEGLKEDECLQLLNTHAFDVEDNRDHKKLKSIAEELVKNLHGSPLAAKVIGGVLNSNLDERHWRCVLNNILGQNDIFSILKLSYIFLPEHLQSCFSYCSIFEQDHLFDKDDLIRLWIAVGFIHPSDSNPGEDLSVEDIGERYFRVLIKKSFFDEIFDDDGDTKGYKMQDLLHELAQFVSTQECFRFVGDEKSMLLAIPKTIRHLSVETDNPEVLKMVGRFKNLRTLQISNYMNTSDNLFDALIETFQETRSIRSLTLSSFLEVIPEEIKYLQHLRYLRFSVVNVKLLPRSLSSLYNLQFIIFDHVQRDYLSNDYFPSDMNNLFNLRYVTYLKLNFPGIGHLKFLPELEVFEIKNENGYRIEELEHMNDLRYLNLTNLNNVRDAEEASNAKLCDKRKLMRLSLLWGIEERGLADRDLDERVLDNLQPHNYLKTLLIKNYRGARSAIWMNEAHLINNLEEIQLSHCLEWEILPPFGQLPFLKTLTLENMPKVKRLENKFHGNDMCSVFPSLEKLKFEDMEALVDWFDASVVDGLFPCLTYLELIQCPNLQELTYFPPKLEFLILTCMEWKTLNFSSISNSIPLTSLQLLLCPNVTSISPCVFSSLQSLDLKYMEALVDWFDANVVDGFFPCLTRLCLADCPNLQEFPYLPPKLESLTINNIEWKTLNCCSISKSFPLKTLEVKNCPNLTSIVGVEALVDWFDASVVDGLFPCLTELCLSDCPNLQELPYLPPKLERLTITYMEWKTLNCSSISNSIPLTSLQVLNCPNITSISPCVFPSLRYLNIENMEALVDWFDANVVDGFFPCLTQLCLVDCPNLQELPYLPPKLERLRIRKIGWKTLNCCSISKSIPLRTLEVENCPNLTSISVEGEIGKLEKLIIERLQSLQSIPCSLTNIIDSVEFVELADLPQLQEYPDLPLPFRQRKLKEPKWR